MTGFGSVEELAAGAELRETHISRVYLTGDRAYKFKKPVRFSFLDYTTIEQRRHFCEEEVRLNRRLAPDVYLGVVEIGGEPAVAMTRLPEERMLDRLLDVGAVTPHHVDRIADVLARFHLAAPRADEYGTVERVRAKVTDNLVNSEPHLPPAWHHAITAHQERTLADAGAEFEDAIAAGRIREGHGDLHAGNVCLRDGQVVIFDCIEFREDYRCCDVVAELAFLTMDMRHRGAADLARRLHHEYFVRTGFEPGGLGRFYECHRACVRGFVEAQRGAEAAARDYYRLAVAETLEKQVILMCGLPGTGKSHVAKRLACALGADLVRSDLVRKELAGVAPTERWRGPLDEGPYDPALTEQTYVELHRRARGHRHIVVDATFLRETQRARFAALHPLVVHVTCPEHIVVKRLATRSTDATEVSDAGLSYYRAAQQRFEPPASPAFVHDGAGPSERLLDRVVDSLTA